ncbi:MAG: VCBS repeat-containing protein [Thermodesulfobacteriota bacterium]|nr:VCBS repeat-containing protein [Thermodesulfobacteriota bacterium]
MKKIVFFILAVLLGSGIQSFSQTHPETPAKIVVLPFDINAADNYDFLRQGIQTMLVSRLSIKNKTRVLEQDSVNKTLDAFKEFTGESLAVLTGAKLKADYVIYGSLTIIGEGTSIDAKITDIKGKGSPVSLFTQTSTLGQVIPEINRFATKINQTLFNEGSYAESLAKRQPKIQQQSPAPSEPPLSDTTSSSKTTSVPEFALPETPPDLHHQLKTPSKSFIPVQSAANKNNYWKSSEFSEIINAITCGDVNNDGIAETVLISDHKVYIYRAENNRFTRLRTVERNKLNYFISVDIADINQNNTPEIFITALNSNRDQVKSMVIEYNGTRYKKIVDTSPWMYRVTDTGQGRPVLLGQKMDHKKESLFSYPIFVMQASGSKYTPGEKILSQGKGNALGTAYDNVLEMGRKKAVSFDKGDYITLFKNKTARLWTQNTKSGGNMTYFNLPKKDPSLPGRNIQYFPTRLITADTNQDGSLEVITACNYDLARGILKDFRLFSKSYIEALEWDGLGLSTIWKTKSISGRISDFFIKDFDNDGVTELVLSLVTKEGHTMVSKESSIVIAYDFTEN